MLKMLKTAKDIVSSARVENSLDNATKTIENWSRRAPEASKPSLPTRLISTDASHGRLPYISSVTNNHTPYTQRAVTSTFPIHYGDSATLLEKPRVVTRPTPLRYTLPARTSHQHIYERTLPVSSLSSPHIAMRDPPPPTAPKPHHSTRLFVDSHGCHQMASSFLPYREFHVPDIYVEHQAPPESRKLYSEGLGHKKRSHSYVAPSPEPRRRNDYDEPTSCLAELRANQLLENQTHTSPCMGSHYQRPSGSCNSCMKSYLEPDMDDAPLLGKEKLNRRASFLRATWGGDRLRHLDEKPSTSASSSSRINMPDLFPHVVVANPKPSKMYANASNNFCYNMPAEPAYLDPAHMGSYPYKPQKLKYSHSTRLPSYREAILQNAAALRRSSSTVVHRQYSTYLNSYTDLPVYMGPLAQGPAHFCDHSNDMCHLFPCINHCTNDAALVTRIGGRPMMYENSAFGGYAGIGCSREEPPLQPVHSLSASSKSRDRRQGLVARRLNSPYVPKPWGRVSSLESEV